MIQPDDLKTECPMQVGNDEMSTTTLVWQTLLASHEGKLDTVRKLVRDTPGLIYGQFNYAPPIHFAVREGHLHLVRFLLEAGAHDPAYRLYPFLDSLDTIAMERGNMEIAQLLADYAADPTKQRYQGDNGAIFYQRNDLENEFEYAIDKDMLPQVRKILTDHPELALDNSFFWGEGPLMRPAKENRRPMIDLLMEFGARVPDILKWTQFYYFERYDAAAYMMERGMNPNTMSWQHVTILHDMAQKNFIDKAELLISYGADLNPIDEAYQSTPLGLAARWGCMEMVAYLLSCGADPIKSGASWSTPMAWARSRGHEAIERLLSDAGGK